MSTVCGPPSPSKATNGAWAAELAVCFFFQAEDGIRYYKVTGVQTCALPIFTAVLGSRRISRLAEELLGAGMVDCFASDTHVDNRTLIAARRWVEEVASSDAAWLKIGRASCRERV